METVYHTLKRSVIHLQTISQIAFKSHIIIVTFFAKDLQTYCLSYKKHTSSIVYSTNKSLLHVESMIDEEIREKEGGGRQKTLDRFHKCLDSNVASRECQGFRGLCKDGRRVGERLFTTQ